MCFWNVFFGFSLTACANEKSGFDIVFIVFAAHSHVRKVMKNMKKMVSTLEMRFGTLRGTLLGSIWEHFGVPLGSHGASLWEKKGSRLKCIWNLENPVCG